MTSFTDLPDSVRKPVFCLYFESAIEDKRKLWVSEEGLLNLNNQISLEAIETAISVFKDRTDAIRTALDWPAARSAVEMPIFLPPYNKRQLERVQMTSEACASELVLDQLEMVRERLYRLCRCGQRRMT